MSKEKIHSDSGELLLCFDPQGNPIAPQPRGIVHEKPYCIWHAVTNIWVINGKGKILCTRRASHVSGNPGKWQTYVGGHVKADSTFSETVLRELAEEIGLEVSQDDPKLVEKGRREGSMHIYKSYAVLFDEDFSKLNFSDGEVSKARWFSFNEYEKSKEKNPNNWCNGVKSEQYHKSLNVLNLSISI